MENITKSRLPRQDGPAQDRPIISIILTSDANGGSQLGEYRYPVPTYYLLPMQGRGRPVFTVLAPTTHFEKLRPCICNETPLLCLYLTFLSMQRHGANVKISRKLEGQLPLCPPPPSPGSCVLAQGRRKCVQVGGGGAGFQHATTYLQLIEYE